MVTEQDFLDAEKELVPSVSVKELDHYQKVRGMFEKLDPSVTPSGANISSSKTDNSLSLSGSGSGSGPRSKVVEKEEAEAQSDTEGKEKAKDAAENRNGKIIKSHGCVVGRGKQK